MTSWRVQAILLFIRRVVLFIDDTQISKRCEQSWAGTNRDVAILSRADSHALSRSSRLIQIG